MTKEDLIKLFNDSPIKKDNIGLILFIEGVHGERELIANPEGALKMEYVTNAYNNSLELISNPKIKIVNAMLFDNSMPVDLNISLGRKMI